VADLGLIVLAIALFALGLAYVAACARIGEQR
jgi:hypothetical protein